MIVACFAKPGLLTNGASEETKGLIPRGFPRGSASRYNTFYSCRASERAVANGGNMEITPFMKIFPNTSKTLTPAIWLFAAR